MARRQERYARKSQLLSGNLGALSDVNVGNPPAAGQDGKVLQWDNGAGEFNLLTLPTYLTSVAVSDLDNGTDGELITWDAAGVATTVAVGTSGHVLTSNGAGAAPTFQAGGGSLTNFVDNGLAGDILYNSIVVAKSAVNGLQLIANSTNPLLDFQNSSSVQVGTLQYGNLTYGCVLHSAVQSRVVTLLGTDSSSALHRLLVGDPDGATDIYYDGGVASSSTADGWTIRSASSNPVLRAKNSSNTELGNLQWANSTYGLVLYSSVVSEILTLLGTDSSSALHKILEGDPNAETKLYYDGTEKLSTSTNGITIVSNADLSPTSTGVGQLKVDGNGYDGYIAMDATAMHVGHNSSARSLILQTDETTRITIGGTGNLGFFGASAVAQPTVTGSAASNAALQSLLTGLANLGLIVDSST